MKERSTTMMVNEVDERMINELKPVLGEKLMIGVLRFCLREMYKKIFGENALYGLQDKGKGPQC